MTNGLGNVGSHTVQVVQVGYRTNCKPELTGMGPAKLPQQKQFNRKANRGRLER